jgi:N-ethylmaleimide reductase
VHVVTDLVAFGRPSVANPDLSRRFAEGPALAAFDPARLFGGDAQGYSDYSHHAAGVAA